MSRTFLISSCPYTTASSTKTKPVAAASQAEEEEGDGDKKKKSKLKTELTARSELYGSDLQPTDLDEEKLKKAREKQREFQRRNVETDDRKRKYNSMESSEVTKEDIEAYRMEKRHFEDPMAKLAGSDELLDG